MEEDFDNSKNDFLQDVDMDLLQTFVGKNYETIIKQKFSIPGFFFGSFYMAYRKMFAYSVIFTLVLAVISGLVSMIGYVYAIIVILVINVVYGFFANRLYLKYAVKRINQLIDKRPPNTSIEYMCDKKGGTSLVLSLALFGMIVIVITSVSITSGIIKYVETKKLEQAEQERIEQERLEQERLEQERLEQEEAEKNATDANDNENTINDNILTTNVTNANVVNNTIDNDITNTTNSLNVTNTTNIVNTTNSSIGNTSVVDDTLNNEKYEGTLTYKEDIDISKFVSIYKPGVFEKFVNDDANMLKYQWITQESGSYNKCEYSVGVVEGYSSDEYLINSIAKFNDVGNYVNSKKSNGITWYYVKIIEATQIIYYHATKKDGNVYVFEYRIGKNVENAATAMEYYNNIFATIKFLK